MKLQIFNLLTKDPDLRLVASFHFYELLEFIHIEISLLWLLLCFLLGLGILIRSLSLRLIDVVLFRLFLLWLYADCHFSLVMVLGAIVILEADFRLRSVNMRLLFSFEPILEVFLVLKMTKIWLLIQYD